MKNIIGIYRNTHTHWVGDGFPVRNLLSYKRFAQSISPFLLLDYAAPHEFEPSSQPRGIGKHPHKGFETVTMAYQGEVAHQDTSGAGGVIKEGDVQWMTAGKGIFHEEFHSPEFSQRGGIFQMIQLWVNLPKKDKLTPARYQGINREDIPTVAINQGSVRVIAGNFGEVDGPAKTFSPINIWDIHLQQNAQESFVIPNLHNSLVVLLTGKIILNNTETMEDSSVAILDLSGQKIHITAAENSHFLILTGEPLNEPIAGHGPFVMNTKEELVEAFEEMYH